MSRRQTSGNRRKTRTPGGPVTLEKRLRHLMFFFAVPLLIMILILFVILFTYVGKYADILHNVTTASEFNQDFKESIDLKMYYYVVESHYSEGLPIQEVEDAQKLAQGLLDTTTDKESWKAISGVLKLCTNLEGKIRQIEETKSYDERQAQLENNIYVLTKLIQEYMYNYLYHEAALLDRLQAQMTKRLYLEIALIALFALLLLGLMVQRSLRFGRSITKPVSALCSRVTAIGEGDLTPKTPVQAQEYEIQTLSDGFEQMVSRLNQLIEQNRQEQVSLRKAELALLQAQINPHFLYNTLDAIVWLVEMEKNEQAVEMVTSLSSFFRSSLSNGRDIITLREEEQHVRSYLEIQQVRYKDILSYEITIDPQLSSCRIPKLTLQPLVENALYHGIKQKRGMGHITVSGVREGTDIFLSVEDDGAGMSTARLLQVRDALAKMTRRDGKDGAEKVRGEEKTAEEISGSALERTPLAGRLVPEDQSRVGFGVVTVHERLQLLFGASYGLKIESEEGRGTCVCVRIPMEDETTRPEGNSGVSSIFSEIMKGSGKGNRSFYIMKEYRKFRKKLDREKRKATPCTCISGMCSNAVYRRLHFRKCAGGDGG
ncbi:MAG: histidine kinase [Lachnospiraceae bacterium]